MKQTEFLVDSSLSSMVTGHSLRASVFQDVQEKFRSCIAWRSKFEARPTLTLALSPRRGRNVRRVLSYRTSSVLRPLPSTNHQPAVTSNSTLKFSKPVRSLFPLPGGEGQGEGDHLTNFYGNNRPAATGSLTSKHPGTSARRSLSSGERARVRASVPLTSLLPPNLGRHRRPRVARRWMRRAFLQRVEDRVTHKLLFPPQLPVPKAQFFDAHRGEESRPLGIARMLIRMPVMPAVEFDGEACLSAIKVEGVCADRKLPTKFIGAESPVAQPAPHEFFSPSLLLSQNACERGVGHDENVLCSGQDEKNGVYARPHPDPLPQERENRSQLPARSMYHPIRVAQLLDNRRRKRAFSLPSGNQPKSGDRFSNSKRTTLSTP